MEPAGRARHRIGRRLAAEVDMSIEINNESGVSVDEVALVELGRCVLDSLVGESDGRAVDRAARRGRYGRAAPSSGWTSRGRPT